MKPTLDPHRYGTPPQDLVGRKIPSDGPVMDISSSAIACNAGGEDGIDQLLDINAGSDLTIKWTNVRPSAPTLCLPFDLLSCYWLITVASRSLGPCHDAHGELQRRLFHIQGHRW